MEGTKDLNRVVRTAWLVAAVVAVVSCPLVVSDLFAIRALTLVGIDVIVVAGLSLLFGYTGQVSLCHAAFFGMGAYASAYATSHGAPWPAGLLAGVAVACAGGFVLAVPSLRLKGHYLAMATLGFGEIMFVVFDNAEPWTGGSDGLQGIPPATLGSLRFETPQANFWLVWCVALLVLLLASNVVRRRPGRALRAIHGSEEAAQACGIDTTRVKIQVFVVSAGLAGLAGVLYAHYMGSISSSSFTLHRSIILMAMVALGGMGSLAGSVLAVFLLTMLPFADAFIPGLPRAAAQFIQDWEPDIYGLTLVVVMLFMPRGLSGLAKSAYERARRLVLQPRPAGEGDVG